MSNKDILMFDFVRAATRYLRNHRRCDDARGTSANPSLESIMSIGGKKQQLELNILRHANRIKGLEADLEEAQNNLERDTQLLDALKNN